MLLVKAGLYPPGKDGFHFMEMDGTKITGRSWNEVERKVKNYRAINGFPKGEPLREVLEQAEKRWPAGFWRKTIRGE